MIEARRLNDFTDQIVRYCFWANAGAIVVLLAFLGQLWAAEDSGSAPGIVTDLGIIKTSIFWFVFGLILSVAAAAASYYFQYRRIRKPWVHFRWKPAAAFAVLVVLSMVFFVWGAISSTEVLVNATSHQEPDKQLAGL